MVTVPSDRRYLKTHEWHKLDGDIVTIGITQIAADELTDITYVGLPRVGARLEANQRFGDIESVKATSDLYSGVSGTVTEVNTELSGNPGIINSDPYDKGWIARAKVSDPGQVNSLLSNDDYSKAVGH
jgi:glycine cleavage system H protein